MKEDILDKYALQLLTDSDKIWLQKALKAEPAFQAALDLHLEIVKGIEMHTEKLFDAAFVELNALADQELKDSIQEIDKELENEGFFEPKVVKIPQPILEKTVPQNTSKSEVTVLPNINETAAKEPIQEVLPEKNISVQPNALISQETPLPNKAVQKPNQLPNWIKIAIAATILLLLMFLIFNN